MIASSDNERNELPLLDALEYLLGDARGEEVAFEQRLLEDPDACECLADLVLLQQAAGGVREEVQPAVQGRAIPSRTAFFPQRVRRGVDWSGLPGLAAAHLLVEYVGGAVWSNSAIGSFTSVGN